MPASVLHDNLIPRPTARPSTPGATPASRVRARLRDATREAHSGAESTAVMQALMAGSLSADGYRALLTRLSQYFRAWERGSAAFLRRCDDAGWRYISRVALLSQDLQSTVAGAQAVSTSSRATSADDRQCSAASDAAADGNLCTDARPSLPVTPARDWATGWGMLYVLEGSTLGARLIAAQLRRNLPPGAGIAYFSLGASDPGHWRRFEICLEAALADPSLHADAIAGAQRVFTDMTRHMDEISA